MTITLTPHMKAMLTEAARQRGVDPEKFALDILRERLRPRPAPIEPQDEWERRLFGAAKDYGVSLSNEALGRENVYE